VGELGIPTSIPDYDWQLVKNPFVAISGADREISAVQDSLKRKYGIDVSLEAHNFYFGR
jgi:hypothetical protein